MPGFPGLLRTLDADAMAIGDFRIILVERKALASPLVYQRQKTHLEKLLQEHKGGSPPSSRLNHLRSDFELEGW